LEHFPRSHSETPADTQFELELMHFELDCPGRGKCIYARNPSVWRMHDGNVHFALVTELSRKTERRGHHSVTQSAAAAAAFDRKTGRDFQIDI